MANETDYKTTIKIEGETSSAENGIKKVTGAFGSMVGALNKARAAISSVMRAMGIFYLAVEGIKKIYEAFKVLSAYIEEVRTRVERAALANRIASATIETKRLVSAQGELNKQLKEQLDLLQKSATLRDMRQSGARAFEDEARDVQRAVERAGVSDPRQLKALEDRYAAEDEARERAQRGGDLSSRIDRLGAEADAYGAKAADARNLREQLTGQMDAELANKQRQKDLGASDEELQATEKRYQALQAARAAAVEEQRTFEREEAYRREQITILKQQQSAFEQLGKSAEQVSQAAWAKIDQADADANKKLADKLSSNEAADRWEREFAKASPAQQIEMLNQKESGARNRLDSLQNELDAEMGKAVADRDEKRLGELRSGIESAQGEMFSARRQREELEQAAIASPGTVSIGGGSRLNAMGLGAGSGVQRVQQEMVNSLKDLVRLGRDQLAALKDIQNEDAGATFQ